MKAAIFTPDECRRKDWTVEDAVRAAQVVLDAQRVKGVNLTALRGRPLTERITLPQLNDIQDQLVSESQFYGRS
jgi:hypothetical protein